MLILQLIDSVLKGRIFPEWLVFHAAKTKTKIGSKDKSAIHSKWSYPLNQTNSHWFNFWPVGSFYLWNIGLETVSFPTTPIRKNFAFCWPETWPFWDFGLILTRFFLIVNYWKVIYFLVTHLNPPNHGWPFKTFQWTGKNGKNLIFS